MTFCRLQSLGDVARCQAVGIQCILVEVCHDDAGLAAIRIGNLGPVHDREIRTDDVLPEVVEGGIRQRRA